MCKRTSAFTLVLIVWCVCIGQLCIVQTNISFPLVLIVCMYLSIMYCTNKHQLSRLFLLYGMYVLVNYVLCKQTSALTLVLIVWYVCIGQLCIVQTISVFHTCCHGECVCTNNINFAHVFSWSTYACKHQIIAGW